MKYCSQCGYENQDVAKFCENCGAPLAAGSPEIKTAAEADAAAKIEETIETEKKAEAVEVETTGSKYEGQTSPLAIVAFIFAFLCQVVGLILGVIDLCIDDGRKKGLSIAAVVISSLGLAVVVFAIIIPIIFMVG